LESARASIVGAYTWGGSGNASFPSRYLIAVSQMDAAETKTSFRRLSSASRIAGETRRSPVAIQSQ